MLTDKEATVLEIMRTDDMLAIGNWQPIIESLVVKGYARHIAGLFHGPTPDGLAALRKFERDELTPVIEGEVVDVTNDHSG